MSIDDALRDLARVQHSVVSAEQARGLGFSRKHLPRRLGEWERVTQRVLRLRGSPESEHQRAMAAVLDAGPGAVLSHHAAAALWELPGFFLRDLHVTRPRDGARRPTRLSVVHAHRVLHGDHVTVRDGIPVTSPARSLFDLAALVHPKRVQRALENAWSAGIVDGVRMARILDDLGKRGRSGTTIIRDLLSTRGPDWIPPASGLEARVRDLAERAGICLERQVDVGGERWLGRVDFYDRKRRLIVQIDSERYHAALIDKAADAEQTRALEAAGFLVLRFTDIQVWYHADLVMEGLRKARWRH